MDIDVSILKHLAASFLAPVILAAHQIDRSSPLDMLIQILVLPILARL
jgi:hypothetical protein